MIHAFVLVLAFVQEEPTATAPSDPSPAPAAAEPEPAPAASTDPSPTSPTSPPSPPASSVPSDPAPPVVAEQPKALAPPADDGPRSQGLRLGLDLGFWRASGEDASRVNAGSPSLVPIGADVSWRTSKRVLLGLHGHAGLASRDDCLGDTACTGRGYGLGAHVEVAFSTGRLFVPWFRYGLGWQVVHHLGAFRNEDAYRYRHALDLLDLRFGGDFVVARGAQGRTTRIGPFAGMNIGIGLDEASSTAARGQGLGGHLWFLFGVRGTTDW